MGSIKDRNGMDLTEADFIFAVFLWVWPLLNIFLKTNIIESGLYTFQGDSDVQAELGTTIPEC